MANVRKFFESLSDSQQDLFVAVTADLQAGAPPEKFERLKEYHANLKREIDAINKRREALGNVLSNVEALLKFITEYTKKEGENFELTMFHGALQKISADLKTEIAGLKPEKKLSKKFDVARRLEAMKQRQSLAGHIFSDVLNPGKVIPSDERNKLPAGESPQLLPVGDVENQEEG